MFPFMMGTKKRDAGGMKVDLDVDGSEKPMNDKRMIAEKMMQAFKSGSVEDLQDALEAFEAEIQTQDEEQDEEMMR